MSVGYATTIEKGAGRKTIAGYDCEQYLDLDHTNHSDGSKETYLSQELWVAPKLEVPVPPQVLGLAPFHASSNRGVTLASNYSGGSSSHSVVAVEIKRGPIDASVFAPPAGVTRVDLPVGAVGSYSSDLK